LRRPSSLPAYDEAVTAAAIVAIVAAVVALLALVGCVITLRRLRNSERLLEREIEQGKQAFDEVVAQEVALRSEELAAVLARARSEALSSLAEEERRIAEERRRDVAERERDATARLSEQLVQAQASVERRLGDWSADLEKLQEGLNGELHSLETKQRNLMTEVEAKIGQDAEGLTAQLEEQRVLISKLRADLQQSAQSVVQQANTELEAHGAERRQALHELSERLRRRERDLQEVIDRETGEATQRIQIALGDIERRQVEQLNRIVSRETTRFSEAVSQQFDTTIRSAREDAARRLSRELDLAVERFAREAEGVLSERLNQVTDAAARSVEERLARLRSALERQRDDALVDLGDRAHQVEEGLRERLNEIATEAESERGILEARLHDIARRIDELAART
jgi:hypothetical protein